MFDLGKAFLRGLAAVLPIALTLYLIVALAMWSERSVGGVVRAVMGDYYVPGSGLIITLALITLIGYLARAPIVSLPMRLGDAVLSRVPLIKSVYTAIKDIMEFMASSEEDASQGRPVLVDIGEFRLVGIVTDTTPDIGGAESGKVLVYMPMSYQVGGYTIMIDESALTPLDMSIEDAMRFVLTAGVRRDQRAVASDR